MELANGTMSTTAIIEKLFDAYTLEEAIYWRQEFVLRLADLIAAVDHFDPRTIDELSLYRRAKGQTEQSIARLQMALLKNERVDWLPSKAKR